MSCPKLLSVFCSLFFLGTALAAPEPSRQAALVDAVFSPDLIMQHAEELGIDDAQKQAMHAEYEKMKDRFPELQQNVQKEVGAMTELMSQESIDEKKAIGQLDKVLDAEREIKRAHLSLILAIRGKLKPEQLKKLGELREKWVTEARAHHAGQGQGQSALAQALQAKMQQVRERAQRAQQDGKDLNGVRSIMEEVGPLMQENKVKEAEAVLDRALKALDEIEKK